MKKEEKRSSNSFWPGAICDGEWNQVSSLDMLSLICLSDIKKEVLNRQGYLQSAVQERVVLARNKNSFSLEHQQCLKLSQNKIPWGKCTLKENIIKNVNNVFNIYQLKESYIISAKLSDMHLILQMRNAGRSSDLSKLIQVGNDKMSLNQDSLLSDHTPPVNTLITVCSGHPSFSLSVYNFLICVGKYTQVLNPPVCKASERGC